MRAARSKAHALNWPTFAPPQWPGFGPPLTGDTHTKQHAKWMTNEHGERVQVKTQRQVKPWFFEQDGGWYVQCRYGARVLLVDGKNNAVFVSKLEQVGAVLDALRAAAQAGELDAAIARAAERKRAAK